MLGQPFLTVVLIIVVEKGYDKKVPGTDDREIGLTLLGLIAVA